ncbi:RNA polymerase II transcription mediator complex subunit 9-domain-containing protein [Xylariales sp. AK1849]|nr:RNA polymerase II transcription mediator complex subunit 9-domain-containing protein [Xylariales sp. AK1849]
MSNVQQPGSQPEQPEQPLALPAGLSPDQLDVLTELSSILARLRTPTTLPSGASAAGATPANPTQASSSFASNPFSTADISLRDFPAATDPLKRKLQDARKAALKLPDMGKTAADQEEEMRELEERIARQRAVLAMLRDTGTKFAARTADRMEEE